jgi:hypothetical protein
VVGLKTLGQDTGCFGLILNYQNTHFSTSVSIGRFARLETGGPAAIGEQSQVVGRFKQEKYNEDKDLEAKVCVLEHFLVQKQPKAEHLVKAF